MQKEAPPSHKLQDHAYELQNSVKLKKNNPEKENARIS